MVKSDMTRRNNMKKLLALAVAGLIIIGAGTISVFAYGNQYIDNDGDGICDNWNNYQGTNYVDDDNDGICDNAGNCDHHNCHHANYVDANNDGICDNYGSNQHYGHHQGNGNGYKMRRCH